jgi:hypothetical protein
LNEEFDLSDFLFVGFEIPDFPFHQFPVDLNLFDFLGGVVGGALEAAAYLLSFDFAVALESAGGVVVAADVAVVGAVVEVFLFWTIRLIE